jgi:hypothetical protein
MVAGVPKNRPKKNRGSARAQRKQREEQRIESALRALETDYERILDERSHKGVRISVFRSRLMPSGTTAAVARMSKADLKNGETVMSQLNPELAYATRAGLEVGYIVVVTECSGGNAYWRRPDLNEVERLIAEGICRHVIWQDVTRMARERRTFLDHADLLEEHGIGLHIAQQSRRVNLDDFGDRMMLAIQVEFAVFERLLTRERTQRGIWDQMILSGKGYFPHPPYGFEFDDEGWLRPYDPEWRWVQAFHHGLVEFRREDGSGYARLAELLREAGSTITEADIRDELADTRRDRLGLRAYADVVTLAGEAMSSSRLSTILKDQIYVDGVPVNDIGGIKVAMKPVDLEDPIPPEVFTRNRQILEAAKGSSIRVRLAAFGLADVLRCGVCGQRLQPYFGGKDGKRAGYRHRDGEIPDSCRGVVYWRDEIEPAIIRELHRLDWDEDRRYRYFELAQALDSDEDYWNEKRREKTRLRWAYRRAVEEAQPLMQEQMELSLAFAKGGNGDPLECTRALAEFHERPNVAERLSELERMKRQIDLFDSVAAHQRRARPRIEIFDPELARVLPTVMTVKVPDGLEERLDRKRAIHACLSAAYVRPAVGEFGEPVWEIRLEGPLGPSDARLSQPAAPSSAAKPVLKKVIRTVHQSYDYLTVRMKVLASSRDDFLRSHSAAATTKVQKAEIPDWVSPPFHVRRTP